MKNRGNYPQPIRRVLDAVLGRKGQSALEERTHLFNFAAQAAGAETESIEVPPALLPYIEKLTHSPYKVVERDIDSLREAGYSEDQIFELTVAGALGAGSGRYQRTLDLLRGDD